MSDPLLPEDLEQWPEDPFELFGISPQSGERELRRAYHRQIKKYKPEHYPDHFRRLNEAYERLKPFVAFHQTAFVPEAEQPVSAKTFQPDPPRSAAPRARRESLDRESAAIASAWKQTAADPHSAAVAELFRMREQSPRDEDLVLRAFWAARLGARGPGLPNRPLEILEAYLQAAGLSGRVFQLYLMELERTPRATTSDSARRLLRGAAAEPRLTELTRAIWLGCRRLRETDRILEDLEFLRDELFFDSTPIWIQVLYQAAEILALHGAARNNSSLLWIFREIRQCDTSLEDDWHEQRWEMIARLVYEVDISAPYPAHLLTLAKESLVRDDLALKRQFQERVSRWTDERKVLSSLDQLSRCSAVGLYLLMRYAERLLPDDERRWNESHDQLLRPRVREFFYLFEHDSYESFRSHAARFCITEDISAEELLNLGLQIASSEPNAALWFSDENVNRFNHDLPLKCLVACRRAMFA
jgi:hypothetical protein